MAVSYEFNERNYEASFFHLLDLTFCLLYDWIDIGLKIERIAIFCICMGSKLIVFVKDEDSIKALHLVRSKIQHTVMCSCLLHLINFFYQGSI